MVDDSDESSTESVDNEWEEEEMWGEEEEWQEEEEE